MTTFLQTLRQRNLILYRAGLACWLGALICITLVALTSAQVLGINAYIKPAKFFASVAIFCWTMGWYTGLLSQRRAATAYSWVVVATLVFELAIIVGQATRGKLSHFNISSPLDGMLFALMGVAITILTAWTGYIGVLFFRWRTATLPPAYLWGIRLGITLFVIFAFQGFMMAFRLRHTVGVPDGGAGLPGLNWSTGHGDLRVAHFFGMHALQLLPLLGYYVLRRPTAIIIMGIGYFLAVTMLLMQALADQPLWVEQ